MDKPYLCYADPGHAWLRVYNAELERLGIAEKISSCSYEKGPYAYLEDDRDWPIFRLAKQACGEDFIVLETEEEHSVVRSYAHYHP